MSTPANVTTTQQSKAVNTPESTAPVPTPDIPNLPGSMPDIDITMDPTPNAPGGAIRLRLPALVVGHILSLLGVCGGTYQLTKQDAMTAQTELQRLEARMERLESNHAQLNERLARIETNTANTQEAVRELRQWLRVNRQER